MSRVIGIDLGTTNSCVAIMDGSQPKVLENYLTNWVKNLNINPIVWNFRINFTKVDINLMSTNLVLDSYLSTYKGY